MWHLVKDLPASIQVLPMRESVFESSRQKPGTLAAEIDSDGVVVYDWAA
jgi:hypothetical protein